MWSGQDWDQLKARIASIPGCEGMFSPGDAAKMLLDTMGRMMVEDNGRVVGMGGSEDKWQ